MACLPEAMGPLNAADVGNEEDEEEAFWRAAAVLLEKVEVYYRELKLKKAVWEKITPTVTRYLVARAFVHVLEDVVECPAENDIRSFSTVRSCRTNEDISDRTGNESSSAFGYEEENYEVYVSELRNLNILHREAFPRVLDFLQTLPSQLRDRLNAEVIQDIILRAETLCAAVPKTASNVDDVPQFLEEDLSDRGPSDQEPTLLPSRVIYDSVMQFKRATTSAPPDAAFYNGDSKPLDIQDMTRELEMYPGILMPKLNETT